MDIDEETLNRLKLARLRSLREAGTKSTKFDSITIHPLTLVLAKRAADVHWWCNRYHIEHIRGRGNLSVIAVVDERSYRGVMDYNLLILGDWEPGEEIDEDVANLLMNRAKGVYHEHKHVPIVEAGMIVGWKEREDGSQEQG